QGQRGHRRPPRPPPRGDRTHAGDRGCCRAARLQLGARRRRESPFDVPRRHERPRSAPARGGGRGRALRPRGRARRLALRRARARPRQVGSARALLGAEEARAAPRDQDALRPEGADEPRQEAMTVRIDRGRAALIVQDMQNDVIAEGGAFAASGAPRHAAEQNVVENCRRLADACRTAGGPVIHAWYLVEDGAKGLKLNAPLFEGVKENRALVKGSWGAEPVPGLERQAGDLVVEKMRMSAW